MTRVSVVLTEHEEDGLASVSGLLAILERISPAVIFLECPAAAFESFLHDADATLESTAARHYRESHQVELIPVDLHTPEAALFENLHNLIERIARTGPAYDQFSSWHRQYVRAHGFAYLNSAHCSDLLSKRHEAILAAIDAIADPKLAEDYGSWIRVNSLRERAMMTNIVDYCRRAAVSRAAFLVGAGHRQSMIDLAVGEQVATASTIQWDFASFFSVHQSFQPSGMRRTRSEWHA